MATVLEEYEALASAYAKRTIRLLQSPHSRTYIALVRALFPDQSQAVLATDAHAHADQCLEALWDAGYRDIPTEGENDEAHPRSGAEVCKHLIHHYRWLESSIPPDDARTEYRLTSEAIETMEVVDRLGETNPVLGASRMRTLVDEISRTSVLFSPDYEEGHAVLRARLEEAQQQLLAYEMNGGAEPLSEDQALDAVGNILELMRRLPVDLRRLEEDVHERGTQLVEAFREDERPIGLLIGDYVERGNRLLEETDHGRSFLDTLRVVGDSYVSADVDQKLETIASSPSLEASRWEQSKKLRDAWARIVSGVALVNAEQLRSSRIINRTVTSRDAVRNRELSRALHDLEAAVFRWAGAVARTEQGPIMSATGDWAAPSLRTRIQAPTPPSPPASLEQEEPEEPLSFEELRRLGGPQRSRILDAIARLIPVGAKVCNVAETFNRLPAELRRPVEVAGLTQLACDLEMDPERLGSSRYVCVDIDGNESVWFGPSIIVIPRELDHAREVAGRD